MSTTTTFATRYGTVTTITEPCRKPGIAHRHDTIAQRPDGTILYHYASVLGHLVHHNSLQTITGDYTITNHCRFAQDEPGDAFLQLPDDARRRALIIIAVAAVGLLDPDQIAAIRNGTPDPDAIAALDWILEVAW